MLTERKDHLDFLAARLRAFTKHLIVLQGGVGAKKRREALTALAAIPRGRGAPGPRNRPVHRRGFRRRETGHAVSYDAGVVAGNRGAIHRPAASIASGKKEVRSTTMWIGAFRSWPGCTNGGSPAIEQLAMGAQTKLSKTDWWGVWLSTLRPPPRRIRHRRRGWPPRRRR